MPTLTRTSSLLEKLQLKAVNPGACTGPDGWITDPAGKELVSYNPSTGALTAPGQVPGAVYYWEAFPIGSTTARTTFARTLGSAASVTGAAEGLTLLAAFTYQRRGFADPFQFKVGLPEGEGSATLTADQYEYVMNLLEQSYPLAIGVDTYDLRRRHVDIAGDGAAEWLSSDTSRTYRRYWRRRLTRRSPDRLG